MSKLITRKIRRIEKDLVTVNDILQHSPDAMFTDPAAVESLKALKLGLEASLDHEMDRSPEEVSRDCMPAEVATELLSSPLARITAPMRRACCSARETHYVSVIKPVPGATKLAARFSRAKLSQLGKWLRRCIYRRYRVQKAIDAIKGTDEKSVKVREFFLAKAEQLDVTRAQLEAELSARSENAGTNVGLPTGYAGTLATETNMDIPSAKSDSFAARALRKFTRLFAGLGGPARQTA